MKHSTWPNSQRTQEVAKSDHLHSSDRDGTLRRLVERNQQAY